MLQVDAEISKYGEGRQSGLYCFCLQNGQVVSHLKNIVTALCSGLILCQLSLVTEG